MTIISDISKKYNWWTQKKDAISTKSQLESIFLHGTLYEIVEVSKIVDKEVFVQAFNSIGLDTFSLQSRRRGALETIIKNYASFK